jgi:hypothetical protein
MKYINKKITDAATGATAECHALDSININFEHRYTTVEIGAFVSAETFKKGLKSMSSTMFQLREVPSRDVDPYSWVLEKLLAGFETYSGESSPEIYAGGTIADIKGETTNE